MTSQEIEQETEINIPVILRRDNCAVVLHPDSSSLHHNEPDNHQYSSNGNSANPTDEDDSAHVVYASSVKEPGDPNYDTDYHPNDDYDRSYYNNPYNDKGMTGVINVTTGDLVKATGALIGLGAIVTTGLAVGATIGAVDLAGHAIKQTGKYIQKKVIKKAIDFAKSVVNPPNHHHPDPS
ncbi:hypothetical protein BLNAU_5401 [Blattamonas nauphoetae]|uniref:Uncharacterized protein n=1 Tax=Blattamonas nauphoetae TaxID=2049346 RepID=A0ABQ9Y776_9EUKA|nr:hypothetical protein BLNAU_5401 [Blattamonas nauphoetae]